MYEHRKKPLISTKAFALRMVRSTIIALALITFALLLGTYGYHFFCNLPWIDAFYNASMILTGMGPSAVLTSPGAKLFASFYALFSGIFFLGTITVMLAPIIHRFMHRFHIEDEDSREE